VLIGEINVSQSNRTNWIVNLGGDMGD